MPRRSKPKRSRKLEVWARDGWTCVYCSVSVLDPMDNPPKGITATVDHSLPRSKGGSNRASNLVTACWNCNMKRADKGAHKVTRSAVEIRRFSLFAEGFRAHRDRDGSGEAGETAQQARPEGQQPGPRSGIAQTTPLPPSGYSP